MESNASDGAGPDGGGPAGGAASRPSGATAVPGECDDGDPCTARDHLVGGECVGTPFVCDDDNPQTFDVCVHNGCMHHFGLVDAGVGPP